MNEEKESIKIKTFVMDEGLNSIEEKSQSMFEELLSRNEFDEIHLKLKSIIEKFPPLEFNSFNDSNYPKKETDLYIPSNFSKMILKKLNAPFVNLCVVGEFGSGKTSLLNWLTENRRKSSFHVSGGGDPLDEILRHLMDDEESFKEIEASFIPHISKIGLIKSLCRKFATKNLTFCFDLDYHDTGTVDELMQILPSVMSSANNIVAINPRQLSLLSEDALGDFEVHHIPKFNSEDLTEIIQFRVNSASTTPKKYKMRKPEKELLEDLPATLSLGSIVRIIAKQLDERHTLRDENKEVWRVHTEGGAIYGQWKRRPMPDSSKSLEEDEGRREEDRESDMESTPKEATIKILPSMVTKEYEAAIRMRTNTPEDFLESIAKKHHIPETAGSWRPHFALIPKPSNFESSRWWKNSRLRNTPIFHDLTQKIHSFPLQFDEYDIRCLGSLFCYFRYFGDSFGSSLLKRVNEEVNSSIANTPNPAPLDFALQFATNLEFFFSNVNQMAMMGLINSYKNLTQGFGKNDDLYGMTPIANLIPNTIHPVFCLRDSERKERFDPFCLEIFIRLALLKLTLADKSVLKSKRLDIHLLSKTEPLYMDGGLNLKIFSFSGKSEYEGKPWYEELKEYYQSVLKKAIEQNLTGKLSQAKEVMNDSVSLLHSKIGKLSLNSFNSFEANEYQTQLRKFLVFESKNTYSKKQYRSILDLYGDLSSPNPVRVIDSKTKKDPKTIVELTEAQISTLNNPSRNTQNRMIGFADMIWINLNRRESEGKRLIGLDLLQELERLSSLDFELQCAEIMLRHSQIITRLRDKPGSKIPFRTNRISRNNMYARLMHQFKMYAENPEKEIARDERPNLDHRTRRLLQPIRLESGRDLELDELPFGLILSIMSDRMSELINMLNDSFHALRKRVFDSNYEVTKNSPILNDFSLLRMVAGMIALEICQLHMMVCHLPIKAEDSRYYQRATRNTVNHVANFDSISPDFSKSSELMEWKKDDTITEHFESNMIDTPLEALFRIRNHILPDLNEVDHVRKSDKEKTIEFVSKIHQFCSNSSPKGTDYVEIARLFAEIFEAEMPKFEFD